MVQGHLPPTLHLARGFGWGWGVGVGISMIFQLSHCHDGEKENGGSSRESERGKTHPRLPREVQCHRSGHDSRGSLFAPVRGST